MTEPTSTWNTLSSDTAQVLFCDLQKKIVQHSGTAPPRAIGSAAGALLQLAKLFSLPTLLSVVPEGENPPAVIDELASGAEFAPQMLRTSISLFGDPATAAAIAANGRRVLIVAGFMLEAVVLGTVLDALSEGYWVIVPVDACGSASARSEAAVLRQMEAAGAVTTSVVSIGTMLSPDLSSDAGKRMFSIVQAIKQS